MNTTAKDRIIAETKLPFSTRMAMFFNPNSTDSKLFRLLVQKQEMLEREMHTSSQMLKSILEAGLAVDYSKDGYTFDNVDLRDANADLKHALRQLDHKDDEIRELNAKLSMRERILGIIAFHATSALSKTTTTPELLRMVLRFILEDAKKVLPEDHDTSVQPEPPADIDNLRAMAQNVVETLDKVKADVENGIVTV